MPDPRTLDEKLPLTHGGVDYVEHSKFSRSKKVVPGPLHVVTDPSAITQTLDAVDDAGASGTFTLVQEKAYRLVSDGSVRYRLASSVIALGTGVYIPANTPTIIASREFDTLIFARSAGTFVQIAEVK